ncbi:MAG: hypothetical protein J6X86_00830 [Bacteroidales bacterium]|nr:hypothetical protein [Bacteroidales bacterium]
MDQAAVFFIRLIIWIPIGILVGKNRKIGSEWGAVLCALLGLIGLLIVLCSKKNNTPTFTNMTKGSEQ